MSVDLSTSLWMAKASDVTYYLERPGGASTCPWYTDVGFTAPPQAIVSGVNAALIGPTATQLVIAFRGTLPIDTEDWNHFIESLRDWADDSKARLVAVTYSSGLVHRGFSEALESIWAEIAARVGAQAGGLPIMVTGHSKGGALATLAAIRLKRELGIVPKAVYTFGSPRVGNTAFATAYRAEVPHHFRFENADDLVPHVPPPALILGFLSAIDPRLSGLSAHAYDHTGLLEFIDWNGSVREGSSLFLTAERFQHLAELAANHQVQKLADDHSLEQQYLPRLAEMV